MPCLRIYTQESKNSYFLIYVQKMLRNILKVRKNVQNLSFQRNTKFHLAIKCIFNKAHWDEGFALCKEILKANRFSPSRDLLVESLKHTRNVSEGLGWALFAKIVFVLFSLCPTLEDSVGRQIGARFTLRRNLFETVLLN